MSSSVSLLISFMLFPCASDEDRTREEFHISYSRDRTCSLRSMKTLEIVYCQTKFTRGAPASVVGMSEACVCSRLTPACVPV